MTKKVPDGWGYTKMKDGREYITRPSGKLKDREKDSILEGRINENGHYYNSEKDDESSNIDSKGDNTPIKIEMDTIDIEASRSRKIGRALASRRGR